MAPAVGERFQPQPDYYDRATVEVVGSVADGSRRVDEDVVLEISVPPHAQWMPGEIRQAIIHSLHQADEYAYMLEERVGVTNWGASGGGLRVFIQMAELGSAVTNHPVVKGIELLLKNKAQTVPRPGWLNEDELVSAAKHRIAMRNNVSVDSLDVIEVDLAGDSTGTVILGSPSGDVYEMTFRALDSGMEAVRIKRTNGPKG